MGSLIRGVYGRFGGLFAELAKFGIVGVTASMVDLGGAGYLHAIGVGPLSAKAISIATATALSYVGNRFWTFRHRANHPLLREAAVFVSLNLIGLVIAEATIGFTYYVLGFRDSVAFNLASVVGTGLGTIFRYWSYKKWVFIAPETLTEVVAEQVTPVTVATVPAQGTPVQAWRPRRRTPARRTVATVPAQGTPVQGSSRGSGGSPFRSGYAGAHRASR